MNSLLHKGLFSCVILIGFSLTIQQASAESKGIHVGSVFPDISEFELEGEIPDFSGKVVLIDFWASWCDPCKDSFPVMEQLYQKYSAKGLIILAVNVDAEAEQMKDFLADHKADFYVVRDVKRRLVSTAGINSMPTSFILDRRRVVRFVHNGFFGKKTEKEYHQQIEELTGKETGEQ